MLSHTNPAKKRGRLRVRVEGSTWSAPFGLDQVKYGRVLMLVIALVGNNINLCITYGARNKRYQSN